MALEDRSSPGLLVLPDYDLFDIDLQAIAEVTTLPRSSGSNGEQEKIGCTVVTDENDEKGEIA